MRLTMSRSQRRVMGAALALAVLPVGAHLVRAWRDAPQPLDPHRPVDGITSDLTRDAPKDRPAITFQDVTQEMGLHFTHSAGTREHLLPEDMGAGVGWIDYDGDGFPDLYFANDTGPWRTRDKDIGTGPTAAFYRNEGGTQFADVSVAAGLATRAYAYGVTAADFNNDGYPDIYVSCYGKNLLFRNNGDGTFKEDAAAMGADVDGWTLTSAAADFDRDGWLDLVVGGYVHFLDDPSMAGKASTQGARAVPYTLNPTSFDGLPKRLLRGGPGGVFRDVTARAGIQDTDGKTLSVVCADFDNDRWPDIYLGNDVSANALYRNQGDGTFKDLSASSWTADIRSAMGIAVGDFDGDGALDMFLTHWVAQENALYKNMWVKNVERGRRVLTFMDVCDAYGLGQSSLDFTKWGTDFIDIDNDGWLDLFVAQGSTLERDDDPTRLIPERPMLYWNKGGTEGFFDVSQSAGPVFARTFVGRGAAMADFDHDGGVDIIMTQNRGPAVLLRNTGTRGHWLEVELAGTESNRGAVGARVKVESGGRTLIREIAAGSSYLSSHDPTAHFGLAAATQAAKVTVLWPSGHDSVVEHVAADRRIRIVEPAGSPPIIEAAVPHGTGPTIPMGKNTTAAPGGKGAGSMWSEAPH